MLKLEVNKKYIIMCRINGRDLLYHATILEVDEEAQLVTFIDKFFEKCTFALDTIKSAKEISNGTH